LLAPARADVDLYAGLEGLVTFPDWKNNDPTKAEHAGGNGFKLGLRNLYFGGELGYENVEGDHDISKSDAIATAGHFTMRDFTLDGFAYYPLGDGDWFQPFLTGGVAYAEANDRTITFSTTTRTLSSGAQQTVNVRSVAPGFTSSEVEWRAGAGVAWQATQDLSVRFVARYQPYSFSSRLNGGASFNFGFLVRL